MLRAAALPGAGMVLPWLCVAGRHSVGRMVHALGSLGLRASTDLEETWRSFVSLEEPEARQAFLRTVRGLIDLGGQRVSATDRLYLTADLPTLIIWGARDPLIPVRHALEAHERIGGSPARDLPGAGHFPHRDSPQRFASALLDFVETDGAHAGRPEAPASPAARRAAAERPSLRWGSLGRRPQVAPWRAPIAWRRTTRRADGRAATRGERAQVLDERPRDHAVTGGVPVDVARDEVAPHRLLRIADADEEREVVEERGALRRRPGPPERGLPRVAVAEDHVVRPRVDRDRQPDAVAREELGERVHVRARVREPFLPVLVERLRVDGPERRAPWPTREQAVRGVVEPREHERVAVEEAAHRERAQEERAAVDAVRALLAQAPRLAGDHVPLLVEGVGHLVLDVADVDEDDEVVEAQPDLLHEVPHPPQVDDRGEGRRPRVQHLDPGRRQRRGGEARERVLVRHPDALGERVADQEHAPGGGAERHLPHGLVAEAERVDPVGRDERPPVLVVDAHPRLEAVVVDRRAHAEGRVVTVEAGAELRVDEREGEVGEHRGDDREDDEREAGVPLET